MTNIIVSALEKLNMYNFSPQNVPALIGSWGVCQVFNGAFCNYFLSVFADADITEDNTESYAMLWSHFPTGTSIKCMEHYGQLINAEVEKFQRFDY